MAINSTQQGQIKSAEISEGTFITSCVLALAAFTKDLNRLGATAKIETFVG